MKVNEIFYSLQGEGRWTGTPAVFVRLSGCNMSCDFCDTRHNEGFELTEEEIVTKVSEYPAAIVVITGGEPTLQLTERLVDGIHSIGKRVHIETNGSIALGKELLEAIDWITCSPKKGMVPEIQHIDELKVVFDVNNVDEIEELSKIVVKSGEYYLQPCDRGDSERNKPITSECIKYIMANPIWKLSLQTHKLIGIK